MKTSRFTWRIFLVPLVTMLCTFFVAPLQAQGQSVEAYVQMSADKTTLTFFYDTKRATREGTTWGIEEKKELEGKQFPAWGSTNNNPNTTTTKAVVDATFQNFKLTSTAYWFMSYQKLATIEGLQYLNTSEVAEMDGMFYRCSGLTSLDLKYFNTQKVTDMSWMFYGCSGLASLNLKHFNTQKVTDMRGMFANCSALTSLDLKSFKTSEVKDMSGMFGNCSALKSLDLKNFNTEKVTDMTVMFQNCSALTSLDLKSFKTENVKDMGAMFQSCSALKTIDLSSFNTGKVEYIFFMFEDCAALTAIYCPNTWKCENSQDMFKGCTQLQGAVKYDASKLDVTMANPNTGYFTKEKPTAIEQMFLNAHKAQGIYTLQGKRVNGSVEHLPAGVYIVNGKKVVVRR